MTIEVGSAVLKIGILEIAIVSYVLAINIVAFVIYGVDKWRALREHHRIRERTLWLFVLLGGTFGALAGMKLFRHKTRKVGFQFVLALIVLLQIALPIAVWYYFFSS